MQLTDLARGAHAYPPKNLIGQLKRENVHMYVHVDITCIKKCFAAKRRSKIKFLDMTHDANMIVST